MASLTEAYRCNMLMRMLIHPKHGFIARDKLHLNSLLLNVVIGQTLWRADTC